MTKIGYENNHVKQSEKNGGTFFRQTLEAIISGVKLSDCMEEQRVFKCLTAPGDTLYAL